MHCATRDKQGASGTSEKMQIFTSQSKPRRPYRINSNLARPLPRHVPTAAWEVFSQSPQEEARRQRRSERVAAARAAAVEIEMAVSPTTTPVQGGSAGLALLLLLLAGRRTHARVAPPQTRHSRTDATAAGPRRRARSTRHHPSRIITRSLHQQIHDVDASIDSNQCMNNKYK